MGEIQVDLQIATDLTPLPSITDFQAWASKAIEASETSAEVCIRLVSSDESKALNSTYRKKNKPTNVLSFPYDDDHNDEEFPLLGDIAICAEIVAQEAKDQNKPLTAHWAHMTIHGILHLLGHDHQNNEEAEAMEALEIQILEALDFDNPYIEK